MYRFTYMYLDTILFGIWYLCYTDLAKSVPHGYVLECWTRQYIENFTCFWPIISVGVSILHTHLGMSEGRVSATDTRGKMKSRVNIDDSTSVRTCTWIQYFLVYDSTSVLT